MIGSLVASTIHSPVTLTLDVVGKFTKLSVLEPGNENDFTLSPAFIPACPVYNAVLIHPRPASGYTNTTYVFTEL